VSLDEQPKRSGAALRINRLRLQNFKGLQALELDFPPPSEFYGDVTVIISKNGGGKTSILQALAIGVLFLMLGKNYQAFVTKNYQAFFTGLFKALDEVIGNADSVIDLEYQHSSTTDATIKICAPYESNAKEELKNLPGLLSLENPASNPVGKHLLTFPACLVGNTIDEGFLLAPLLFLHAYRKIRFSSLSLSETINPDKGIPGVDAFKKKIIRYLMAKSGLILKLKDRYSTEALDKLNNLLTTYAGVTLNNELDTNNEEALNLMVTKQDGSQESFLFDHLSSGQKEIIYTYFTIWETTRDTPSVVLIDEPELHLNAEWQVGFIETLRKLAPHNQYIITTHSQHITGSVPTDRCLEIVAD
jgi:AAA15 family ATPase/GTPase